MTILNLLLLRRLRRITVLKINQNDLYNFCRILSVNQSYTPNNPLLAWKIGAAFGGFQKIGPAAASWKRLTNFPISTPSVAVGVFPRRETGSAGFQPDKIVFLFLDYPIINHTHAVSLCLVYFSPACQKQTLRRRGMEKRPFCRRPRRQRRISLFDGRKVEKWR